MAWTPLELVANLMTVVCIFLAGRNNIHTWWTGIVACVLFGVLFYSAKLYADVTLQFFFIVTGVIGWLNWTKIKNADTSFDLSFDETMITKVVRQDMYLYLGIAIVSASIYGFVLHTFTDAYAPWIDSSVLVLSILGQLLLMKRKLETWPVWIVVNVLSVPLYFSRELYLTSALYFIFLIHALWAWRNWMDIMDDEYYGGAK